MKVAFVAGLSGIGHVGEGHTSGYPSHQLCACPGVSVPQASTDKFEEKKKIGNKIGEEQGLTNELYH